MEHGSNQKLKLIYLYDILMERTDDEHSMTLKEIIDVLGEYGISAERKALYTDIEQLQDYGLDIIKEQKGKNWYYYIGSRDFEEPELKLIVDAIQSSKFITVKKSNELIKKLEKLGSRAQAKKLQQQVYVTHRVKTTNEKIYFNVDKIHSAINSNCKIKFQYFQWNVKKEMELRHNGDYYSVSPWALTWDDENYYLVGYDSRVEQIRHYRVDKMVNVEVTKEQRDGKDIYNSLDMAVYSKKVFGMFSGDETSVHLECKNELAGVIIDRFGTDIIMVPQKNGCFTVNVNVVPSSQFLGWVFSLDGGVKILGPEKVKNAMREQIKKIEV